MSQVVTYSDYEIRYRLTTSTFRPKKQVPRKMRQPLLPSQHRFHELPMIRFADCLGTCQFSQACAVFNPASLQILLRRSHARNNASASGDKTTVMFSPVSSKEQSSKSEKTARGLPGSNHGWRL